ncbi:MAG: formylglycine-generating enzyme family protein [Paracoccaceae bacterium]|nr:formylglycine-generating enzyme family protein [Paracoccaceae bacterium]
MPSLAIKSCCTPSADRNGIELAKPFLTPHADYKIPVCEIPGGTSMLGTAQPMLQNDNEEPLRKKQLKPFKMMQAAVTNQMFADFVEDTNYVTEAEEFGWSFVFYQHLSDAVDETQAVEGTQWWRRVEDANWRLIGGSKSETDFKPDHPVVHVSWADARAFAKWAGGRLPNEAEWEHAARGGLGDVPFPWGEKEPNDTDFQPCNIWQGTFPTHNSLADGYSTTAPAISFDANGYGLYNMCGNVWEWTSEPFKFRSNSKKKQAMDPRPKGSKLLKGGSFLCHKSYCFRYRIAARTGTTPDTATSHQGFRLVF